MKEFMQGLINGARRTPRGYVAPAIVLWRLLVAAANEVERTTGDCA